MLEPEASAGELGREQRDARLVLLERRSPTASSSAPRAARHVERDRRALGAVVEPAARTTVAARSSRVDAQPFELRGQPGGCRPDGTRDETSVGLGQPEHGDVGARSLRSRLGELGERLLDRSAGGERARCSLERRERLGDVACSPDCRSKSEEPLDLAPDRQRRAAR